MKIKIGDVVKFRIKYVPKEQFGIVVEITEAKESINPERIGLIEYHVNTLDNTVSNFALEEKNIENVYRSVESGGRDNN